MASWIFSSLLLLWPLSQLLLFRRWLPLLFLCCCCHCCFCCTWSPVFWSCVYTDSGSPAFVSQSSGCASAAALLLLLLYFLCCFFFFSVTSSAPITRSRQEKTTQEANFCNGRRVVSQPIYQVTKLFAHITREWVFALIIANLAFRWRFVLYQLQHCLFSTCHSSPTKKNAPSSAFVGNGFEVIWSSLRIVIAKGLIQTEIVLAKCAPSGARAISCNLTQFFFFLQSIHGMLETACVPLRVVWFFEPFPAARETKKLQL